jgi:hypothetical protein
MAFPVSQDSLPGYLMKSRFRLKRSSAKKVLDALFEKEV